MKKQNSLRGSKKVIVLMAILFFLVFNLDGIKANFVCGKVLNARDNMLASWFNVRIFYPDNREMFSSCEVSPAGNKYCCDTEAIPGRKWKIGDNVTAEIFDNVTGYVAGPVSIITTGEGYDVMPEMRLEKVITINSPKKKLLFSNETRFFLNLSFRFPYINVEVNLTNSNKIFCDNCTRIEKHLNGRFGVNHLEILAKEYNGERIFREESVFSIVRNYTFKRTLECEKCKDKRLKGGSEVKISLFINLSDGVEDVEVIEQIPSEWEVIDPNGGLVETTTSFKRVIWNVSGKTIVKSYVVKIPKVFFLPRRYLLETEMEGFMVNNETVTVYRFPWFIFFPVKPKESHSHSVRLKFRGGVKKPLVIRFNDSDDRVVSRVAFFSNDTSNNSEILLGRCEKDDLKNIKIKGKVLDCYSFDIVDEEGKKKLNISKIFLEIRKPSEVFSNNISVVFLNGSKIVSYRFNVSSFNSSFYSGFFKPTGNFVFIMGEKEPGFFMRFLYLLRDSLKRVLNFILP